ncbi:MAG: hypothetical protein A2Y77_13190 [Planctomycetes bacterium RBG_13_62_9]|nr:MAG: hypothetical protein A2Y77_13190 [Planctomycetes bacterium RBG_13_62_9]
MRDGICSIFAVVIAVTLFAGCQQQEAPSEKQARLQAAQNADVKQALEATQAEIKALQQKHARELQQRDQELAKYKARIEALQKDLQTGIAERVKSVTTAVMEENAKLRQEIEQLKAQMEELKKQPKSLSQ